MVKGLYDFYIFMDGDAQLLEARDFGRNTGNPFTTLQNYLVEWQPAAGFVHKPWHHITPNEVQTGYNFDHVVAAFHWEAARYLLPYEEKFDDESWWYCSVVTSLVVNAFWHPHNLQFNALQVVDHDHNTYPKGMGFGKVAQWLLPGFKRLQLVSNLRVGPDRLRFSQDEWFHDQPQRKGGREYVVGPQDVYVCHPWFRRALCEVSDFHVPHADCAQCAAPCTFLV
mmetsp:Transcript_22456/g.53123  ORF Transcript_22456/g.53123 Transcript_22456/m.53123 type:complete len:225 (+) Transcript_22456:3-677(+)